MYGLFGDITQVQVDVNSGLASWVRSFQFWLDLPKICVIPVPQLFLFHRFCVSCLTLHFLLTVGIKVKNLLRLSHLEQQRNYLPKKARDKDFFLKLLMSSFLTSPKILGLIMTEQRTSKSVEPFIPIMYIKIFQIQ